MHPHVAGHEELRGAAVSCGGQQGEELYPEGATGEELYPEGGRCQRRSRENERKAKKQDNG